MNRYISSFIISSIFYLTIITGLIYFVSIDDSCKADVNIKATKRVCFSIVTQPETSKPKIEKKTKPKKKPKSKPKSKPKPKPKPKPKMLPVSVKEELIPELIPEPIVEGTEVVEEETKEVVEPITEAQNKINHEVVQAKQDLFISHLIHKINSNKSYPNMARRRGIEGLVNVKFKILSDGNVEDIKIVSGRSIFKKSTIEAISRSFPVIVKDSLFDFPREFKINISYILK
ncbi:energy transducer TonB [Sulfurimonas sp.]|uniref:energy transducer TonB n=1 Tax=Sulfurimonas sp. TaxID=2022749 RepID=UPI002B4984CB|nr:energy transducer TonB [Sulfurimonas sp.]